MAIQTLQNYIDARKQKLLICKYETRSVYAGVVCAIDDLAGPPGAGSLNPGNSANGIVPDSSTAGYPSIIPIQNTGYLTKVKWSWDVPGILFLADVVFAAGAYSYNADTTLSSQPSYAARMPNGSYGNTQIRVYAITNFTGTPSFQVNYLDQDGNAGDTGVVSVGYALTIGDSNSLPLAAGDSGVSQITRIRATVASAGTFGLTVCRGIWCGRIDYKGQRREDDLIKTKMEQIFSDSALSIGPAADSTSSGHPWVEMEIADG
jgi:hypothetical protein